MKKLLTAILIILFIATRAWAAQGWVKQSSQQTTSAAITTSGGLFHGVMVVPDVTGTYVTIDVYDNATAASGTKLIPTTLVYSMPTSVYALPYTLIAAPAPVRFYNGLYISVDVSGCSTKYMVFFESE